MNRFRRQLWEDRWLHLFVAGYGVATLAVTFAAGRPDRFAPLLYARAFLPALTTVAEVAMATLGLWALMRPQPGAEFRCALRTNSGEFVACLLMLASTMVFYGLFTSLKNCFPEIAPFRYDAVLSDLDLALHFGRAPWRWIQPLTSPAITGALVYVYLHVWWPLLEITVAAAVLAPQCRPHRQQFLWSLFLSWALLGSLAAAMGSSVGPIFYERLTGSSRYHELTAYLAQAAQGQTAISNYLWASYQSGQVGWGSGISAFPSIHVTSATLMALLAQRLGPRIGLAMTAFAAVILFGSIHLGWHYAVDGYAAALGTLAIWQAVGWSLRAQPALRYAPARPRRGYASASSPPNW